MTQLDQRASHTDSSPRDLAFSRFSAPVLGSWAIVCVLASAAHDFRAPALGSLTYLGPVYLGLYLFRMMSVNLKGPLFKKISVSLLFGVGWVPFVYALSSLFMTIEEMRFFNVCRIPRRAVEQFIDLWIPHILCDGAIRFLILTILAAAFLTILERILVGSTAGKRHMLGLALSGLASLLLTFDFVTLVFLIVVPLPHLLIVWRGMRHAKPWAVLPFGERRALRLAASVAVAVYGIAVIRYVPAFGWEGVFWPSIIRHHEAQYDFEVKQRSIRTNPDGRGRFTIAGRPYFVPAQFLTRSGSWEESSANYDRITIFAPYSRWIDGLDVGSVELPQPTSRTAHAEIIISADRAHIGGRTVHCIPERVDGLRQCFFNTLAAARYLETSESASTLEPLHLSEEYRPPNFSLGARYVLAVDDNPSEATAASADSSTVDGPVVVAGCLDFGSRSSSGEPSNRNAWLDLCSFHFDVGGGKAWARVLPSMLPHWREIRSGIAEDLNDWTAAAEDALPIDVAADQLAAEHVDWLLKQPVSVAAWCQADRFLVAALGIEWTVADGFGSRPFCRRPVVAEDSPA